MVCKRTGERLRFTTVSDTLSCRTAGRRPHVPSSSYDNEKERKLPQPNLAAGFPVERLVGSGEALRPVGEEAYMGGRAEPSISFRTKVSQTMQVAVHESFFWMPQQRRMSGGSAESRANPDLGRISRQVQAC
jgi:hypothetical protein